MVVKQLLLLSGILGYLEHNKNNPTEMHYSSCAYAVRMRDCVVQRTDYKTISNVAFKTSIKNRPNLHIKGKTLFGRMCYRIREVFTKGRIKISRLTGNNLTSWGRESFSKFTVEDWDRLVDTEHYEGAARAELLLGQYSLYEFGSYLEYLKVEVGEELYEEYMCNFYKFITDSNYASSREGILTYSYPRVNDQFGHSLERHPAIAVIEKEYERIQRKRNLQASTQKDKAAAAQKKSKEIKATRDLQEFYKTHEQVPSILRNNVLLQHSKALSSGYHEVATVLKNRIDAMDATIANKGAIATQYYTLSNNVNDLIRNKKHAELNALTECTGTRLQQELHREIIVALDSILATQIASAPFVSSTIDITNIAIQLNKSGHVDVASDMVDTLLAADNYLKAMAKNGGLVLKGIAKGTLATASSVAKSTAHLLKETGTVAAHLGYAQYNPMKGGKLLYEDGQKMAEAAKRLSRTLSHASLKLYRLLVLLEETGSPDSVGHITSEKEQQNIKEILNIVHAKDIQQFTRFC